MFVIENVRLSFLRMVLEMLWSGLWKYLVWTFR